MRLSAKNYVQTFYDFYKKVASGRNRGTGGGEGGGHQSGPAFGGQVRCFRRNGTFTGVFRVDRTRCSTWTERAIFQATRRPWRALAPRRLPKATVIRAKIGRIGTPSLPGQSEMNAVGITTPHPRSLSPLRGEGRPNRPRRNDPERPLPCGWILRTVLRYARWGGVAVCRLKRGARRFAFLPARREGAASGRGR
jgi:hypothetical protein